MTATQRSTRRVPNSAPGRRRWIPWAAGILLGMVVGGGVTWAYPPPNAAVLTTQAMGWYQSMRNIVEPSNATPGTPTWVSDPKIFAPPPVSLPPERTGNDDLVTPDTDQLVNVNAPIPDAETLAAAVEATTADLGLSHRVHVVDAATGQVLVNRGGADSIVPASTLKLFTAMSALHHLDAHHRFTTSATYEAASGVTLIGGGDGLLATRESTGNTVGYAGLTDLAQQTWDAIKDTVPEGQTIDVRVDVNRYAQPFVHPTWTAGLMQGGWVSPIYPINTWGGFVTNPAQETTAVEDGATYTGTAFANRLSETAAADGTSIVFTYAGRAAQTTTTEPVAQVRSAPFGQQLEFAMKESNNMLFEMFGREAALAADATPNFQGATDTTKATLEAFDFDTTALSFVDNSGLSPRSRATLESTLEVYQTAFTSPEFRPLLNTLTIAGYDGTMRNRLTEAPYSGIVRSKTGTLEAASSNAGLTVTADGRALWFAINTTGADGDYAAARTEQDLLVAAITDCGCAAQ